MTRRNVRVLQRRLKGVGFILRVDGNYGPQTQRTIARFREGFVGDKISNKSLPQAGRVTYGDRTWRAVRWSAKHGGRVSPNFSWREFACNDPNFPDIRVIRGHVVRLEKLRQRVGPITIVSGYRTERWNRIQSGASNSQHLYGAASDHPEQERISVRDAIECGFTGIGYDDDNRFVEHLDSRDLSENNTTGAQVGRPTMWVYS